MLASCINDWSRLSFVPTQAGVIAVAQSRHDLDSFKIVNDQRVEMIDQTERIAALGVIPARALPLQPAGSLQPLRC